MGKLKHVDLILQVSLIIFMEIYLYFNGLYSLMFVTILFLYMASGFRVARSGSQVCIIVLGDIGRSPRMQYHAISFAKLKFDVDIIGYGGSVPHPDLVQNASIKQHILREPPSLPQFLPKIFQYVVKVLFQVCQLFFVLFFSIRWPSHIMVQNPPSIPTLFVAWCARIIYGSKYIIDWHNYGYTILGMSVGSQHLLVRFATWFENFFGKKADGHFCVTNAMKEDLKKNWSIKANTLYDRPPEIFQETALKQKHELFLKLSEEYSSFGDGSTRGIKTAFTEDTRSSGVVEKSQRPALLISSTSWTEDEDFSILLGALEKYEKAKELGDKLSHLPPLVCAITGKGPQKKYYQDIIAKKSFKHVKICTPWLTAEDYPLLLGAADLGVCLHTSSSGLDLPMKVVDMFGCGLPVCAINFNCLNELVKHEENGLIFQNESELAEQLQVLLCGFPEKKTKLQTFRENLKSFQEYRWEESWTNTVKPTLYV
ncbi:chitobiosyldiphosphodolichol beta-mannosyltransferase-like [Anneissia japonica]|uniref:chitobiosyldiphosphodolichol beta-mannosyltransferase-like n=1 Tax=Anneissia japonica TaxID=1529436 RepID=UPI0014257B3B|nr:chitobiosyldiphosphodolichol beta-mannosyltransferase-like [Anneissia japonica]